MKKKDFYAVILSGGSGERFWPLSTPERPKQFLSVFGGKSLLRQSFERVGKAVPPGNILVITGKSLAEATYAELPELPRENVICEPCRRDTAAAIALACMEVSRRGGKNAVAAVLPADHLIKDKKAFRKILSAAAKAADTSDCIVTMGVKPTYPATGFGYIKIGVDTGKFNEVAVCKAEKFIEKPDAKTAKRYLRSGNYAWNAGMFVWKVSTLEQAFKEHAPHLLGITAENFKRLPKISFDYAVMEKAHNILITSGDFGWDDVGTWTSAEKHFPTDGCGNSVRGNSVLLDCSNSLAVSEGPRIAALGVNDLVIVGTKDSVLVVSKDRAQDIKKLLSTFPDILVNCKSNESIF